MLIEVAQARLPKSPQPLLAKIRSNYMDAPLRTMARIVRLASQPEGSSTDLHLTAISPQVTYPMQPLRIQNWPGGPNGSMQVTSVGHSTANFVGSVQQVNCVPNHGKIFHFNCSIINS